MRHMAILFLFLLAFGCGDDQKIHAEDGADPGRIAVQCVSRSDCVCCGDCDVDSQDVVTGRVCRHTFIVDGEAICDPVCD